MSARRVLCVVVVASGLCACGGSSSETPFPLPPHPLNEPYRVGSAVQPKPETEQTPVEPLPGPAATGAKGGPASGTWGSSAPEPLPELSPK